MLSRKALLAILLGLLLVSAPLIKADEEEYDDDDAEEADDKGGEEKDVVVITKDNFADKIKGSKFALLEFYAPWCGHCQKLIPEYAKAATAIKKHDPSIVIAKCDATKDADLAKEHDVSGYPTLKWFVDGKLAMDYNGPRDAEGIIRWIKKKTGPPAEALEDKDALEAAEKAHEVIVVAYFKELKGSNYDAFKAVAQKSEDATFYETTDAAVAKAAGLSKEGVAVITNFPSEERGAVHVTGSLKEKEVQDLLNANKLPPTIEFNDKNSAKIFGAGIDKQLLLLAKAKDLKKDAKIFKAYREVAGDLKGKVVFVTVDMDGTGKDPVTNFFGVKEADAPVIVGFDMTGNKKYKHTEKINAKNIKAFVDDFLAGKLTPEFKSAPIPEEPTDGGVSIIVGKNFDEIVKDESKDVLLEVYAPWCGHCKALEPIYKKLAKRFNKVDSVVIAKMDGTENEHPDVDVKGFPTIIFYPAGKGAKPITFEGGDRSLKALTKFIKKNAKVKFELPKKKKDDDKEDKDSDEKDEL